jgi:hypothetical protein
MDIGQQADHFHMIRRKDMQRLFSNHNHLFLVETLTSVAVGPF